MSPAENGAERGVSGLLFGHAHPSAVNVRSFQSFEASGAGTQEPDGLDRSFERSVAAARARPEMANLDLVGWFTVRARESTKTLLKDEIEFHNRFFTRPDDVALVLRPDVSAQLRIELFAKPPYALLSSQNYRSGFVLLPMDGPFLKAIEVSLGMKVDESIYLRTYNVVNSLEKGKKKKRWWRPGLKASSKRELPPRVSLKAEGGAIAKPGPAKVEPLPPEALNPESTKVESYRADAVHPEPPKVEAQKPESIVVAPQPPTPKPEPSSPALTPPPPVASSSALQPPLGVETTSPSTSAAALPVMEPKPPEESPAIGSLETEEETNSSSTQLPGKPQTIRLVEPKQLPKPNQNQGPELALVPRTAGTLFAPQAASAKETSWLPLVAIFVLTAGLTFSIIHFGLPLLATVSRPARPPQAAAATVDLGMHVESQGQLVMVSWHPALTNLQASRGGTLTIYDGARQREIHLDAGQVADGSVLYKPTSPNVVFHLEFRDTEGLPLEDSVRVLGGAKQASRMEQPVPRHDRGRLRHG